MLLRRGSGGQADLLGGCLVGSGWGGGECGL